MKTLFAALVAIGATATTLATTARAEYVRLDGVVFDSDVGAACGALHTDVLFQPDSTEVELHDDAVLDFVADCLETGPLADARIAVAGMADGSWLPRSASERLARQRMNAVIVGLIERGVDARRLEPWAIPVSWPSDDKSPHRVVFRILEGAPSWMQ